MEPSLYQLSLQVKQCYNSRRLIYQYIEHNFLLLFQLSANSRDVNM